MSTIQIPSIEKRHSRMKPNQSHSADFLVVRPIEATTRITVRYLTCPVLDGSV